VPIPGLEEGTERAMNGGEVEIQGLEVGFRYAPTPAGFLYAGYSYLDADGEQLRIDPVPPDGDYKGKIYRSLFAGMAPASDPRLVLVVMVDEPRGKSYYGGSVAGPVFSEILTQALRLLNVPPDEPGMVSEMRLAVAGGDR
jgi:outer membrane receptor protein involved in Fe transport